MNSGQQSSSASAAPQAGQVPDLMKIGAAQVNTQMDVETDILEPVVFNQKFTRFRLQNKGILHSNSKLTFAVDVTSHAAGVSSFPLNIGVHAIIDRCVLKTGNKTICETSDFGHFSSYQSSFINPQHNKQREAFTTGRMMCRKWLYKPGKDNEAEKYTLDFGNEVDERDGVANFKNSIPRVCDMQKGSGDSKTGTKTSPVFQIALNDLFPFLKMNQLPLYMFKEDIDLEIHYADQHKRGITVTDHNTNFNIDSLQVSMIADYIYYPQEMMEAYANANSQMSFTYVDYRLNKRTINNSADISQTVIQNVGGAGRIVNKVFYMLSQDLVPNVAEQSLTNIYSAQGTRIQNGGGVAQESRNMGVLSHNLRYNDNYLYPIDITNRARLFSNLALAHGSNPFVSKDEYSGEQDLITDENVQGRVLKTSLDTKLQFVEDRLNRNERINSRGLELYDTWGSLPPTSFTWRVYLEVVRLATLNNGILTPTFA